MRNICPAQAGLVGGDGIRQEEIQANIGSASLMATRGTSYHLHLRPLAPKVDQTDQQNVLEQHIVRATLLACCSLSLSL